ncbi:MAG: hypothetical protein JNK02_05330 [Planctomycetes bacterium]|nr:hypothetical protein [Planctomycetota bacterium]
MKEVPRLRPTVAAAAALLAWGCASTPRPEDQDARWLVAHGYFDEAVRKAAAAVERAPEDPAAQRLHRETSVAWHVERGRRLTFADQDVEAIEAFLDALAVDPQSRESAHWLEKTRRKLALRELGLGLELHANDQIAEAVTHYEAALAADPLVPGAREARELAVLLLRYRAGLGTSYFKDGLHAYSDYWLEYARSRFDYAQKYQGAQSRARDRRDEVQALLAVQRLAAGRAHEEHGRFGAARGEYRMAVLLDPGNEDAKAALERARTEQQAGEKLKLARIEIVRGRPEKAQKLAEEALALTTAQQDLADGVLAELRDARLDAVYRDALAMERDWRFAEAADRYDELLAEAQFWKDAIARRDTLREYVRRAAELYEKSGSSATPEEELQTLRQIELFWPEYRDVPVRIRELTRSLGSS